LGFVTVGKLNVRVLESELVFRQFFESDDDVVGRSVDPGAFGDEGGTDFLKFGIFKDTLLAALDVDFVASFDELLCGRRCYCGILAV
jgi:hypothetical protein